MLYWFVSAAIPEYHKLNGLTEMYCLTVLEGRSPNSRCCKGWFLLRTVKGWPGSHYVSSHFTIT